MVMMDRSVEEPRSAKRLRTESPRRDDVDGGENWTAAGDRADAGMCRIGEEYQANVSDTVTDDRIESRVDALLVWRPSENISDAQVDEFCAIAKQKYKYNQEQALGLLCYHHHSIDSALADLANFTPFPDDWSVEDKVLFDQGFSFHGKSFHRIRQLLPDKPIASLVKYYYHWKKTRTRSSLMDRQARKLVNATSAVGASSAGLEAGSGAAASGNSSEASSDMSDGEQVEVTEERKMGCSNCGVGRPHSLQATDKGLLCGYCYQYWRKSGQLPRRLALQAQAARSAAAAAAAAASDQAAADRGDRKPPRGINLNQDDLFSLLDGSSVHTENLLKTMEAELALLKTKVQSCKQHVSILKSNQLASIADYKPAAMVAAATAATAAEPPQQQQQQQRVSNRWTNDELLLAVQGIRKYGKNFKAIADVIGTKTEAHVCNFFTAYKRRYNLDEILAEHEADENHERSADSALRVAGADDERRKKREPTPVLPATSSTHPPPPLVRQTAASPQRLQRGSSSSTVKLLSQQQLQQPPPPLIKAKPSSAIQA